MFFDKAKLQNNIRVSTGKIEADLVFKNAKYVNVFTDEILENDIAVNNGVIVGVGKYNGKSEIDLKGKIVVPGFIDGHIHLESSMLRPSEFAKAVCIHGTTGVIADPHEIANVCGEKGIEYMLEATEDLPISVYFMMPSCVPATSLDESGANINSEIIKKYYNNDRILGLAEMMNYVGVVNCDDEVIQKLVDANNYNKKIDGHAPSLSSKELNSYVLTGVNSDHECSTIEEAKEKIRLGQYIMIREGTAAKNLDALINLFEKPYCNRTMLVTDDKHPGDLKELGHIDYIIRKAVKLGANPIYAIKMATINAASYFGIRDTGAIAPGYIANLVILGDLEELKINSVYYHGEKIVENNKLLKKYTNNVDENVKRYVHNSFNVEKTTIDSFKIKDSGSHYRVMELEKGELLTTEIITDNINKEGINKIAVVERHKNTGHIGLGFMKGYGLNKGAIATSVAHDSHNLIVAGTNDNDMSIACNAVIENQGGWAICLNGEVIKTLALPIAGLMSEKTLEELDKDIKEMKIIARELGVSEGIDPFMTLGFLSLPVIPTIKMTTYGFVDVKNQKIVPTVY